MRPEIHLSLWSGECCLTQGPESIVSKLVWFAKILGLHARPIIGDITETSYRVRGRQQARSFQPTSLLSLIFFKGGPLHVIK